MKKNGTFRAIYFIIVIIILFAVSCEREGLFDLAKTKNSGSSSIIYVSADSGSDDSGDGSSESPYVTINKALNKSENGNMIYVQAGVYNENLFISKNISLYGGYASGFSPDDRNWKTNITTIESSSSEPAVTFSNSSSSRLDGFVVNGGSSGTGDSIAMRNENGAMPVIENNVFHSGIANNTTGYSYCIQNRYSGTSPVIRNNELSPGEGAYVYAIFNDQCNSSITIAYNRISCGAANYTAYGIYGSGSRAVIYNNLFIGSSGPAVHIISDNSGSNSDIRNNTMIITYSSTAYGVYISGSGPAVQNNIFYHAGTSYPNQIPVYESGTDSDPEYFMNNCFYGFSSYYYDYDASSNRTSESELNASMYTTQGDSMSSVANVIADPGFADPVNSDYHLSASSPSSVVSGGLAGSSIGWGFADDIEGNSRPGTGSWSIGAYQY